MPTNNSSHLQNSPSGAPAVGHRNDEALRLLAEASNLLTNCTNYEATLEMVAGLLVSSLATWCSIDIVTKDHKIERVAVNHRDPVKAALAQQILQRYPAKPTAKRGVYRVIETGKSILISETPRSMWAPRVDDPEHLDLIMELGSTSYMCVPLIARGRVVGSMMLLSSERTYNELDLKMAEDLALPIAMAMDNVQMFRDMQDAVKVREEFLAILSHELRTPLNVIQGWIDVLKSKKMDKQSFEEALDILDRNTLLQSRMINDLLDVSRISVGKLTMDRANIALSEVIHTALDSMFLEARKKKINLHSSQEKGDYFVSGDLSHLVRAMTNLLSNAIKFTPDNGRIDITLKRSGDEAIINVSDTGPGIKSDFLPFVFESFRQENSTSSRSHSGLGLGLTIAKHIVEQHGGQIYATNFGLNSGANLAIHLPLVASESKELVASFLPIIPANLPLHGMRIMLVEDSEDLRSLLSYFLQEKGALVFEMSSAVEALTHFPKVRPDLIISDLGLPEEDGYSFITKIRKLSKEQGGLVAAFALSAYASESDRRKALASGFDMHLAKPITAKSLIGHVLQYWAPANQPLPAVTSLEG